MQGSTEVVKYRFDFLKYRYVWLVVSIGYLLLGAAAYVMKGGFNYHIDFTGGAEIRVSFDQATEIGKIREVMSSKGWKDAIIQSIGSTNKEFLIIVGDMNDDTEEHIKTDLNAGITGNSVHVDNIQWVGPEAGKDTTRNAVWAVLLSLIILLLYIAVRFEFRFGVGAIACLVHDILAILAFLLITREAMSLHVLASILAVLGYSLNDVIVVFSRIRENFSKIKGASEYDIVNLSINQTLRRTIMTSFATALSVMAILLLGGETLRSLSLVMLVGIIVGTYSSIYIASPVMLATRKLSKKA